MMDLDENYTRAGFSGHLPFGYRPALLIVDVCNAYLDPASALYAGVEGALDSNVRLVAAARQVGMPVVFTRVAYSSGGRDGGLFYRKVPALAAYLDDNPLGDFHDKLRPDPGEMVVTKQYASAFFGTSLSASLTAMARDCLLITGFSTSGCVRATALDALQHGFVPYVVSDACGDRAIGPHEASLSYSRGHADRFGPAVGRGIGPSRPSAAVASVSSRRIERLAGLTGGIRVVCGTAALAM